MKWVYKLERKFGRICIPHLMLVIIAGQAMVYLANLLNPDILLLSRFSLNWAAVMHGEVWRLLTFVFIPQSTSPLGLVLTLYFYYLIGNTLENTWGDFQFNVYYLCGMLGAILAAALTGYGTSYYINLSLFFAFAMLYPDFQVLLFFIIPIKMKYMALFSGALCLIDLLMGGWSTRAAVLLLSRLGDGRIDDETVLNWSYLVAPGPCNAIPDKASAKAFAMSRDNDKLAAYLNAFVDAAAQVAEETGAKMDASYVVNYPSFYVPSDRPPIRIMERVFSKLGIPISVQHGAGGLDANRLNGYGIECVGLATGYSGNHTVNEVLELEDLIRSGEMVEQIILESAAV